MYVTNQFNNLVSVINTATNTVVGAPISVGNQPVGVAVSPNGARVYVANISSGNVSVIDTATNTVVGAAIAVGGGPFAFGQFIGPAPAVAAPAAVPTLSEWAMILFGLMLAGGAAVLVQRRRQFG